MRPLAAIEADIAAATGGAAGLLRLGEEVLEHWVSAHGEQPTDETREGFRLLGLHRQGAKGDPSFNACRETCRELVYHYNLIAETADADERRRLLGLASRVAMHLYLFVAGKLEEAALGDFCCSSRDSHRATWQRENERDSQQGAMER